MSRGLFSGVRAQKPHAKAPKAAKEQVKGDSWKEFTTFRWTLVTRFFGFPLRPWRPWRPWR